MFSGAFHVAHMPKEHPLSCLPPPHQYPSHFRSKLAVIYFQQNMPLAPGLVGHNRSMLAIIANLAHNAPFMAEEEQAAINATALIHAVFFALILQPIARHFGFVAQNCPQSSKNCSLDTGTATTVFVSPISL